MKIVIVGTGNIATFFAQKLIEAQHEIVQVISATLEHAKDFANVYKCDFTDDIRQIYKDADAYIFAVKDDVLIQFSHEIILQNKLVIHTAGSVSLAQIKNISDRVACIWCVYSINKNNLPIEKNIPLVVNSIRYEDLNIVKSFAETISENIYELDDVQKSNVHLAAVFANNFVNHLYTISYSILDKKNISFDILKPIIQDTAQKILKHNPAEIQTGPAIRGDEKTMKKHLGMLKEDKILTEIYLLISESIILKNI